MTYEALLEWLPLAEQGDPAAQFDVSFMYYKGRGGVAQDLVLAHMWCDLAARYGHKYAPDNLDQIAREMTPAQLDKAQRLAREWMAKRGK